MLKDFIEEYLNQLGKELTEEQRLAIDLIEAQYPNESWELKPLKETQNENW